MTTIKTYPTAMLRKMKDGAAGREGMAILDGLKARVEARRPGEREEYLWYYLREIFPNATDGDLAWVATWVEAMI
jgi:hypothetical protein